jgi:hypothetical protein
MSMVAGFKNKFGFFTNPPEANMTKAFLGATTLNIMTFSLMTLSIMALSKAKLSITTLSIMKFSLKTLSITTFSIMTLGITINKMCHSAQ